MNSDKSIIVIIKALFSLTRPLNNLILFLAVLIAMILTHRFRIDSASLLALVTVVLISSGGNVLNDYFDIEIDRINKPNRPLPAGQIQPARAMLFSVLLFICGCAGALGINRYNFGVAVLATFMLIIYNAYFKKRPLSGNVIVSFLTACAFIYGGLAIGHVQATIIPAVFSFFFHLGREIIKDVEDYEGDSHLQAFTLPIMVGRAPSLIIATLIYALVIILTFIPYFFQIYNSLYLWVVSFGVNGVLICLFLWLWLNYPQVNLGRISKILKYDMFIGLLALYLG